MLKMQDLKKHLPAKLIVKPPIGAATSRQTKLTVTPINTIQQVLYSSVHADQ
jgi:hypothetical protein